MADFPSSGSNRIEVDLKLLQDQNLGLLRDFGDKFESSVDKLVANFATYAEQISAAADRIAQASGATDSSHESRAKPLDVDQKFPDKIYDFLNRISGGRLGTSATQMPPAREAGQPPVPPEPPTTNATPTPPGDDSKPPPTSVPQRWTFAKPNLTEYEQAQFALGTVPNDLEGVIRYLSHYTGLAGWDKEGNERSYMGANFMRGLSGGIGGTARGLTAGRRLYTSFSNATGSGEADAYAQLGYDRTGNGPFGLLPANPFFSRANAYGIEQNIKALKDSWFGLNPNLSIKESKNINSAVVQAGWSGSDANSYRKMLEGVRADYGITDFQTVMNMSDKSTRFGVQSVGEFRDSIKDVSEAARAAHINMNQFVQSLDAASDSLSQSIGLPYAFAKRDITAFSGATGLDPSRAPEILSNKTNLLIAMGQTHKGAYDLIHSPHYASLMTGNADYWAERIGGAPMNQWAEIARTDPERWHSIRNKLKIQEVLNPDIKALWGNRSTEELIQYALKGSRGKMRAFEGAEEASARLKQFADGTRPDGYFMGINDILHKSGLSEQARGQILTTLRKGHLTQEDIEHGFENKFHMTIGEAQRRKFTGKEGGKEREYIYGKEKDRLDKIQRFVSNQSRQTAQQKRQYEVTLSPEAKRLLRWMDESKAPKSAANAKSSFADRAFSWETGGKVFNEAVDVANGDLYDGAKNLISGIDGLIG